MTSVLFLLGFMPLLVRDDGPFDGIIFTGWREHVVMKKASNFLNGYADRNIHIKDIFKGIDDEDVDRINVIVENLREKSSGAVKNAIEQLAALPRVLLASCGGSNTARNIYITFLTLVHFYKSCGPVCFPEEVPGPGYKVSLRPHQSFRTFYSKC